MRRRLPIKTPGLTTVVAVILAALLPTLNTSSTPFAILISGFYFQLGTFILIILLFIFSYLFKAINKNTRKRGETCSKLSIKTPERRQWLRSGVFIANWVFLFLSLNQKMLAGSSLMLKWKQRHHLKTSRISAWCCTYSEGSLNLGNFQWNIHSGV